MIDAIVTAGGKGTRIKDVAGEKPLIDVLGTPLIERVLGALRSSSAIDKIFVTVSQNTPMTKSFLEKEGVNVVMTSGDSYVDDLKTSMRSPTSDHVLVCPSDMPLLTSEGIDMVIERFYRAKVGSFSVTVPKDTVLSLGINPTYSTWIDGREVVLCGVSVVDKGEMLTKESLVEGYTVVDLPEFAINVNTLGDLRRAESMLKDIAQRRETKRA